MSEIKIQPEGVCVGGGWKPEEKYEELEYVDDINIYYIEYSLKLKKIGR